MAADCESTGGVVADTGFNTVMTAFIRTPNGKELAFDVALQCGLITFTKSVAKGPGSGGSKTNADGRIQVRVAVTPVDNDGLNPGTTLYAFPQNDGSNDVNEGPASGDSGPDGVTYCRRFQELEVTFENLICEDNVTAQCQIAVSLLLNTLTAHSFNFVLPNVTSGPKMIEVQARATADANVLSGTADAGARGEAFVGMGSMMIETVRAVNAWDETTDPNPDFADLN